MKVPFGAMTLSCSIHVWPLAKVVRPISRKMKILRLEFRPILTKGTASQIGNGIIAMIEIAGSACETVVMVTGFVIWPALIR